MKQETFEIEAEYEGERLDKYLSVIFEQSKTSSNAPSRSFFQKLIRDGHVKVNDSIAKANYRLRMDDLVCVEIPDAVETPILPEDIPLDILYEDDDLLVVNKPKGMVVHPSAGHYSGTLVNAIMFHCKDSLSGINGEIRPGSIWTQPVRSLYVKMMRAILKLQSRSKSTVSIADTAVLYMAL